MLLLLLLMLMLMLMAAAAAAAAAAAVVVVGSNSILGFALLGLPRWRLLRRSYPYLSCRCESERGEERGPRILRALRPSRPLKNRRGTDLLPSPFAPAILFPPSARRNEPTARTRNFLSREGGRNSRNAGDFVSCSRGGKGKAVVGINPLAPRCLDCRGICRFCRRGFALAQATFAISPTYPTADLVCSLPSPAMRPIPRLPFQRSRRRRCYARTSRAGSEIARVRGIALRKES